MSHAPAAVLHRHRMHTPCCCRPPTLACFSSAKRGLLPEQRWWKSSARACRPLPFLHVLSVAAAFRKLNGLPLASQRPCHTWSFKMQLPHSQLFPDVSSRSATTAASALFSVTTGHFISVCLSLGAVLRGQVRQPACDRAGSLMHELRRKINELLLPGMQGPRAEHPPNARLGYDNKEARHAHAKRATKLKHAC